MDADNQKDSVPVRFLDRDGASIAYRARPGKENREPGVLFCAGLHSVMVGLKARAVDVCCAERELACTRFDYQGHGESSGAFAEGTIGLWRADALAVLDRITSGPQVLVGSSMGGWMALLLARARPERVRGLVLIAPATDFPTALMLPALPKEARMALEREGVWHRPSEYEDECYPITRRLIEEGADHAILDRPPLCFDGPVRIFQGAEDELIPPDHPFRTAQVIRSPDMKVEILPGGNHRLSRPEDLVVLHRHLTDILDRVGA